MNTLMSLVLVGVMALGIVGCDEESTQVEEKEVTKVEEKAQEPKEEKKEEPKKEETIPSYSREDEEFNKHISTAMSEEEYVKYFKSIEGSNIIFDATVMSVQPREGYDTVFDILVACESGPYVRIERFQMVGIYLDEGDEVNVRGLLREYDEDRCYLKVQFATIEQK